MLELFGPSDFPSDSFFQEKAVAEEGLKAERSHSTPMTLDLEVLTGTDENISKCKLFFSLAVNMRDYSFSILADWS